MANDKNGILHDSEALWDVALRGIGIQLPDEYVLRFVRLMEVADKIGLEKVSLSDVVDIEHYARQEMKDRMPADADDADVKPAPKEEPAEDRRPIASLCPDWTPAVGLNELAFFGITTIGQLSQIRKKSIKRLPHIGPKTLRALEQMLHEQGLTWGRKWIKAFYYKVHEHELNKTFYRFSHIELTDIVEECSKWLTDDIIPENKKKDHSDLYFIDN